MVNVVHSRSCEHIATQGRRADHLLYVVQLTHAVSHLGRKTQDFVFFVNLLQTAPFSGANIGVTGFVRMLWVQNVT